MTDAEAKTALGNLLAVIHGDGGQAINRLGWAEACRQAEALVVEHFHSRHRAERLEQRLRDLGFEEPTPDQLAWNRLVNSQEVDSYKPSWVGDSRGYDQARENPPVVVDGVTISVGGTASGA